MKCVLCFHNEAVFCLVYHLHERPDKFHSGSNVLTLRSKTLSKKKKSDSGRNQLKLKCIPDSSEGARSILSTNALFPIVSLWKLRICAAAEQKTFRLIRRRKITMTHQKMQIINEVTLLCHLRKLLAIWRASIPLLGDATAV